MAKKKTRQFDFDGDGDLLARLVDPGNTWAPIGPTLSMAGDGDDDVAVRKFKKDIIKVGNYTKVSDDLRFSITEATIANWVVQFDAMKEAGVKVPIPCTHKGDGDPNKNFGYVDEMWAEDGTLWMSASIIGADAIRAAARSDVSIYSPPSYTDGSGNDYERPITHVAMCTNPVIPGLGEFIPIAASMDPDLIEGALEMAADKSASKIKKLGTMLGIDDESMSGKGAKSAIMAAVRLLFGGKPKEVEASASLDDITPEEGTTLVFSGGVWTLSDQDDDGLHDKKPDDNPATKAHPMLVKSVSRTRRLEIQKRINSGHLTLAQGKLLEKRFIGEGNKAVVLELSQGGEDDAFDDAMEMADLNISRTGERTGPQADRALVLSDPNKIDNDGAKTPMQMETDRRVAAAKA